MISKIYSAALMGIDAYMVEVKTHIEGNIPYFGIVGLPDGHFLLASGRCEKDKGCTGQAKLAASDEECGFPFREKSCP